MEYLDLELDDLAKEMNVMDDTLYNTMIKVEQDKPGVEWLEH